MNATVLSDAALCAAALAALLLARPRHFAMTGFALLALAAAAGCLRYGGMPQLQPLHQGLSFVAGTLGLPLVLLGYAAPRGALLIVAALVVLSAAAWMQPMARLAVALTTLLGWALLALRDRRLPRVAAAIALGIAASLVAGVFAPQGKVPNIDLMHYALALAQLAFGLALHHKNITMPSPTQARPGETCGNTHSATPPAR